MKDQRPASSDLWGLFLLLGLGAVMIILPGADRWIMRSGLVVGVAGLLFAVGHELRTRRQRPHRRAAAGTVLFILAFLGIWAYVIIRAPGKGHALERVVAALIATLIACLIWLASTKPRT
jgi:quinol-cytochrome oxidoreductase complex cytochrome b subunit